MRYEILIAVRPDPEGQYLALDDRETEYTPLGHADTLDEARAVAEALTDQADAYGPNWEVVLGEEVTR